MTCQVAVMNKNGLALATDSAVTLGPQRKVYHSAEKLFRMSDTEPVAVMTYGNAEMLGIPWGTIIKTYRRKLGERRFDYLDQYAEDFLRYLESSNPLFPLDAQVESVRYHTADYWRDMFLREIWKQYGEDTTAWPQEAWSRLSEAVAADREIWMRYEKLALLGPGFGDRVLNTYSTTMHELESHLFDGVEVPHEIREGLLNAVKMMYEQDYFCQHCTSGVVIAGFGEQEAFPKVLHYKVDTVVAGRLRYRKVDESIVTRSSNAFVIPFAQTHMVDLFYGGIFPTVQEKVPEILDAVVRKHLGAGAQSGAPDVSVEEGQEVEGLVDSIVQDFSERLEADTRATYTRPLIAAVGALPLSELCGLADALVSLTLFKARMSADEASETVGGDIDVAAISKGDGFVWVQRKDLVGARPGRPSTRFL